MRSNACFIRSFSCILSTFQECMKGLKIEYKNATQCYSIAWRKQTFKVWACTLFFQSRKKTLSSSAFKGDGRTNKGCCKPNTFLYDLYDTKLEYS